MSFRRGNKHQVTIEGHSVWLDSDTEELALNRFIDTYGFTGNWKRSQFGIKHDGKYYSPDFELSIDDHGRTSRAIVEVKQYRRDFTRDIVKRMCAIAYHFNTKYVFLYTTKNDTWYQIAIKSGKVQACAPPHPGTIAITDLWSPRQVTTKNPYGRKYRQSFSNIIASAVQRLLNSK